jgi:hypothetical protein
MRSDRFKRLSKRAKESGGEFKGRWKEGDESWSARGKGQLSFLLHERKGRAEWERRKGTSDAPELATS